MTPLSRIACVTATMVLSILFCFWTSLHLLYWALVGDVVLTVVELMLALFWGGLTVYIWRRRRLHPFDWIPGERRN